MLWEFHITRLECCVILLHISLCYFRSASPRRKRKERSPTPRPTKIHVGRLTRNVTRDHILEIFSTYGTVKSVDFPQDRLHTHTGRGFAYIEFETPNEAENAMKHMDGGKADRNKCSYVYKYDLRP
jgi:RNA recognition motif-containing protein